MNFLCFFGLHKWHVDVKYIHAKENPIIIKELQIFTKCERCKNTELETMQIHSIPDWELFV